ncbi:MAG TPA: sigma-70 family RNA polymerase sigma factor [Pirellulaceae bacterium]|nr:sigma-70 family RNA polymerase sigma factor [Pirellulaceae bacterium]
MSRQELMSKYLGLVRALAWKIHRKLPKHVDVEELVGYGHLGLAEAAKSFDESRGLKFSTFAYHRIRGSIFDGLAEMNWFRAADYHAGSYEHSAEPPDPPGPDGAPPERASLTQQRSKVFSLAQMEASQGDSISDGDAPAPGSRMEQREVEDRLSAFISKLPAQTQQMIRWVYYDGMTLKEVAERMGHDKSWASRLHASALRHLQQALENELSQ